jgi:amidase
LQAAEDTAKLLAELGHTVEHFDPSWQENLLDVFTNAWSVLIGSGIAFGQLLTGRAPTADDIEPLSWELYQRALKLNALEYSGTVVGLQFISRTVVQKFAPYDAVLTPALAMRPVKTGTINGCSDNPMADFEKSAEFTPFTSIWNLTGQPAISLPLFHGEDGLPLAVQIAGRPAGEEQLLALANQIETAMPWSNRFASTNLAIH